MPHKRAKRSVRLEETKKRGSNLAPSQSKEYDDAPRGAMRVLNSMSTQAAFRAKGLRSSEDTGERKPKPKAAASGSKSDQKESNTSAKNASGKTSSAASTKGTTEKSSTSKGKDMQNPSAGPSAPVKPVKSGNSAKTPSIMPHESLGEYNRRVESIMRAGVSQAIKSANKTKAEQEKAARVAKEERRKAQGVATLPKGDEAETAATAKPAVKKRKTFDVSDAPLEFAEKQGPRRLNDIAQAPPSLPRLRVNTDDGSSIWTAKSKGRLGLSVGQERIMEEERERVIKQYREIKAKKEGVREAERAKEEAMKKGGKKRKLQEEETGGEVRAVAGAAYDSD